MKGRKTEIRSFHPISKYNVEKSSSSKKDRNVAILFWTIYAGEQGGEEIIQKAAENIAETVPESLPCKFFNAAQKNDLVTKIGC